jgi:predicted permease
MDVLGYVSSAGGAMMQMGLFCVAGIVLGLWPRPDGLLSREALAKLSQQTFYLYTPCLLLATFGSKLSVSVLRETIGLIAWSIIHMAINYAVGWPIGKYVVKPEPHLRRSFILALTFNNNASVPLLLLAAVCKGPQLAQDATAVERSVMYTFTYALVWNLLFWSLGLHYARGDSVVRTGRTRRTRRPEPSKEQWSAASRRMR